MEIWKDIPEYKGLYQVSSLGNVRSLERLDRFGRRINARILKPNKIGASISNLYYAVGLCKEGKVKTTKIHVLVAISFLNHKPCGHKLVVDHINNNQLDNRLENLQIITHRENISKENRKKKGLSSKYIGVSWYKRDKKWRAEINIKGKHIKIGHFDNEHDAHLAYQNKLKEIQVV